jgi:hypothetical protein
VLLVVDGGVIEKLLSKPDLRHPPEGAGAKVLDADTMLASFQPAPRWRVNDHPQGAVGFCSGQAVEWKLRSLATRPRKTQ